MRRRWRSRSLRSPLSGCSYNTFVSQEEAIKAQWAQVENQLQRRNDLIPNLVETVKGFAQHEEGVFKDIADARSRLLAAQDARRNDRGGEPAVVRARPAAGRGRELSAAQGERTVQPADGRARRHREPHRRRAHALQRARAGVQHRARQFPANITAKMFGFKEYPFFEAPAEAKQVPKVNFGKPARDSGP